MSHFIVGRLSVRNAIDRTEVIKQLAKVVARHGLIGQVVTSLSEQIKIDILSTADLNETQAGVLFEIFGPSGTADEIISPYVLYDQWPRSISGTLNKISDLASDLLYNWQVSEFSIVFSEGYDTFYPSLVLAYDSMVPLLLKKFEESCEVPSLKVVISN